MKKVRFESPLKVYAKKMGDAECHSPRPFMEKQENCPPEISYGFTRLLPYNPDPVQRFENSNSYPYPIVSKTSLSKSDPKWVPSNDLDLSILDNISYDPRNSLICNRQINLNSKRTLYNNSNNADYIKTSETVKPQVLSSIENMNVTRPTNNNVEKDNFFIRPESFHKFHKENVRTLQEQLNKFCLSKEDNPLAKKTEIRRVISENVSPEVQSSQPLISNNIVIPDECTCHHCIKVINNIPCAMSQQVSKMVQSCNNNHILTTPQCLNTPQPCHSCKCNNCTPFNQDMLKCVCNRKEYCSSEPQNAVNKKNWMLQTYEQNKKDNCMELEKQRNVVKEKREPTVADLFKIIKLQNEQLQLLQEKVDKFITVNNNKCVKPPIQKYVTEQVAYESVDSEQHKISIGVMTSFEMVRTSTVINKEIHSQSNENAQIHCNKSQISIKEVVSQTQPVNLNFLDGITPNKPSSVQIENSAIVDKSMCNSHCGVIPDNINDDKTLNELSLYNVQVDNATTPLISPEQSLYLDIRDYSDSESASDDQSNVGWTYYNKVMTHVNGMLQDSDMPSSASALYRNTRQQCVQMQFDKTNVSVTKRVKFGDDPLGIHQPHIYAASTDTSLKMNQLAAKYLKEGIPLPQCFVMSSKPSAVPLEMSFATRNYMERHRILQGSSTVPMQSSTTADMPRFLDITALKQQPKFL